ncbi:MAG TPA: CCA tRNA nucleotidyltransferase [Candidatus Thermoplasmatota archaeon]|nr:CCA tRNA nucleotidyltransferase [Candidatus Thermoplasmatota archaeon]
MKAAWKRLRPKVLRAIKPSAALTRQAVLASRRLSDQAQEAAAKLGVRIVPCLVGSLAKETHLKPHPDIDVFLLFDPATPREALEEKGLRIGKKVLRSPTLKYAEHPYVHGRSGNFVFDVVPAYNVREAKGRLSAVDRSPFHAKFVKERLSTKQRDEVRILKQFLKGTGCYGAETATSGFSGYLAELLVLRFKAFDAVVDAFARPRPPRRLSLGRARGETLGGEFVFVDPVDATRNAAAAVSRDRFERFLRACRAFRTAPTKEFFWPPPVKVADAATLRTRLAGRGLLALEIPLPKVRLDAVGPHVRRLGDKVARRLVDEGFSIKNQVAEPIGATRMLLLWETEPAELPDVFEHRGPPVDDAENSRRFLQKWQGHPDAVDNPHPVDGRWRVKVRRHDRTPASILHGHVGELLRGVELPAAQRRLARLRGPEALLPRRPARLALTKLVLGRDPWEN